MNATQLILNEEALDQFCTEVLPELTMHECFFIMLAARNKYLTEEQKTQYQLRKGSDMLCRVLCKSNNFKDVKRAILKMTPVEGLYTDSTGKDIPHNAYVVFITPNPRGTLKAVPNVVNHLVGYLVNQGNPVNMDNAVYSEIHKSCSRKKYFDIDVDFHTDDDLTYLVQEILNILKRSRTKIVKTRGGVHILLDLETIDPEIEKTWYKSFIDLRLDPKYKSAIELISDSMVPVPGCTQGGLHPYLTKFE